MTRAIFVVNQNEQLIPNARQSMEAAAYRWDAELVIEEREFPGLSPNCVKTLAFKNCSHDDILVLDADTVIWAGAPNPFSDLNPDALCVVGDGGYRHGDDDNLKRIAKAEWTRVEQFLTTDPRWRYRFRNMPPVNAAGPYFNAGFLLARRRLHAGLFEVVEELCRVDLQLGWQDQTPFNMIAAWRAVHGTLQVADVDEAWNFMGAHWALGPGWKTMASVQTPCGVARGSGRYIYHFAGTCGRLELMAQVNWRQI